MLKSFKSFTDAVVPIETFRSVKVALNPTRCDIVARDAKGSSMIGAFVARISTMTIHMLHGKSQSVLNTNHRLLTRKCQVHMCAGLSRDKYQQHAWIFFLKKMTVHRE